MFLRKRLFLIVVTLGFAGLFLWATDKTGDGGAQNRCAVASVIEGSVIDKTTGALPAPRLLAAQVLVLASTTYAQLDENLKALKSAGVNTVIVRAFQNPGDGYHGLVKQQAGCGAYFETRHAHVVEPILSRLTGLAHGRGLRVFAWMETRSMPLAMDEPETARAQRYSFDSGLLEPIPCWSIFDKRVEDRLVGLYRDVALTGVDGILIQDDLVMRHDEDFSTKAVARFERETGIPLDASGLYNDLFRDESGQWRVGRYSDTFWVWSRWKNEKLLGLAQKLILAAKAENPRIKIAMNFMYESVTDASNALAWLSQSLTEAKRLSIDYYAVMAYHRQIKKELNLTDRAAFEAVSEITAKLIRLIEDPHKILVKVQMTDWETRLEIPSWEADEIFQRIKEQGTVSLAFIPYSQATALDVIGRHFHQGS